MEERINERKTSGYKPLDVKDVMDTDSKMPSRTMPASEEMSGVISDISSARIDLTTKPEKDCDNRVGNVTSAGGAKKDAGLNYFASSTDKNRESVVSSSSRRNCGERQMSDSLSMFPTAAPTTASSFTHRRLPVSPPANAPLSCDTTGSIKTPTAPPIDGLLTIATPNLLKYGHGKEELVMEEDSVDRCCPEDSLMGLTQKDPPGGSLRVPNSSRVAGTFTNAPSPFRPASPAAEPSTQLRHRRSLGVSNQSSPRSFSPPILRSASAKTTATDTSGVESRSLNTTQYYNTTTPGKLSNISFSSTTMPSSLSPFALQHQPRQQQQHQRPSPHIKAMPRRDLRLDFLGGPISLKRCNSAPAIDLKLVANIQQSGPFSPTTPTTPTSEASAVDLQTTATTPTTSSIIVGSSSSFTQNSTSPSLLPSPTRRPSSTLFRPIPAMSPSAGGDGNDVGKRIRRFSSNSVGGGSGGGGRSTSPYPLPRTPSRLEQVLQLIL